MTPNDIEVLIHCHASGKPHPRLTAPAVQESIAMFLQHELIEESNDEKDMYNTTDGGKALMKLLCSIDFPKQIWVDKNNKII